MGSTPGRTRRASAAASTPAAFTVRAAAARDLDQVIAIDASVTGTEKRAYWHDLQRRFGGRDPSRQFLVAAAGARVVGFVIGEIRDWEFGSPPCGWVFAIDVHPDWRERGVASALLQAACAGFAAAGVSRVRTLLARDDALVMSFFRSQGMMAAPLIALEMDLQAPR